MLVQAFPAPLHQVVVYLLAHFFTAWERDDTQRANGNTFQDAFAALNIHSLSSKVFYVNE